jgi:hypothetical protein
MRLIEHKVVKQIDNDAFSSLIEKHLEGGWKIVKVYPLALNTNTRGWSGGLFVLRRNILRKWRFGNDNRNQG